MEKIPGQGGRLNFRMKLPRVSLNKLEILYNIWYMIFTKLKIDIHTQKQTWETPSDRNIAMSTDWNGVARGGTKPDLGRGFKDPVEAGVETDVPCLSQKLVVNP